MKLAATISLVPEAKGGPFIYWDSLENSCRRAKQAGFDGVEIFAPSGNFVDRNALREILGENKLQLAAAGTGAGCLIHKLQLCDPDSNNRAMAKDFIREVIDFAGEFKAPAILGSMQGRWNAEVDRDQALGYLGEALEELGRYAQEEHGVMFLYEPLNRYETNLITSQVAGAEFLGSLETTNVKLLCDLFHMNIEERSIAECLVKVAPQIGHIHFVDSNRSAAGMGHIDFSAVAQTINEIEFQGYLSVEAIPLPDTDSAAKQSVATFRKYFS